MLLAGPFRCKVCNKNFSRNTNLTKHLRIHEKSQFRGDDETQLVNNSSTRNRNYTESMVISLDPFNDHDSNVDDEHHLNNSKMSQVRNNISTDPTPAATTQQYSHMSQVSITPIPAPLPPIHMPLPNPINIPAPKPSIPVPVQLIEPIEIEPEPETSISLLLKGNSDAMEFSRHVTGDAVTFRPNKMNKGPIVKPKTFFCDSCPKKFASQSSLLNHKNIHSSENVRNHICTVCSKSFMRKRGIHSTTG